MWSFLNPAALFGLIAAGIPIILHLLSRRRVKIIEFSSVAFLSKMKQSRLRYVRLKELILLAIRTLIIAFLALGFSRPTYKRSAENTHGPSSTVVLLDDSYSMSRQTASGTLFEIAKSKIIEIMDNLSPGDKIAVIPFSKSAEARYKFLSPDPSYFTRLMPEYATTPETTLVVSAIKEAVQLLEQSVNLNRELVIISDFGLCGWTSIETVRDALKGFEGNVLLTAIDGEESDNAYLASIDYGGQIIQPGVGFEINTIAKNATDKILNNVLVDLYLDDKRISQAEISLRPAQSGEANLRANVPSPGIHHGFVETQEDELPIDNRFYFAFKVPENIRILIAGLDNELSHSIQLAASPPGLAKSHIIADFEPISKVISMGIVDYDAAILGDYHPSQILASRIKAFIKDGHGVFIIPASAMDVKMLNEDLGKLNFPVQIQKEFHPGSEGSFKLEELDINHPIFVVYRELKSGGQPFRIPDVNFRSIYDIIPKGTIHTLASLSGNKPLLMASESDGGNVILSSAPFSANLSDITSSSLFLPMIQRVSEYLASKTGSFGQGYKINEIASLNLPKDDSAGKLEITKPSGESINIQPRQGSDGYMAVFDQTNEAGIYFLKSGGQVIDAFAVNIDTRESEPGVIDHDQLASLLPENRLEVIDQNENVVASLEKFRTGREFTVASFGIVLFLMVLEMAIAGRWRERKE